MDAIFIWSSALVICVGLPLFFTVINVITLNSTMHTIAIKNRKKKLNLYSPAMGV